MYWRYAMRRTIKVVLIAALFVTILAGCDFFKKPETPIDNTAVDFTNNSQRVELLNAGSRLDQKDEEIAVNPRSIGKGARSIAPQDTFKLIAQVNPPSVDGQLLGATSVVIIEDKAYVTYNLRGEDHKGAVDIIDIADPKKPELLQTLAFKDMDVNGAYVRNNYLYLIGGMDYSHLAELVAQATGQAQNSDDFAINKAIVERYRLDSGLLTDESIKESVLTWLPGYQTTSIYSPPANDDGKVYVTAGDYEKAGVFVLDAETLKVTAQQTFDDAKYLHISDAAVQPAIAVLKGSKTGADGYLGYDRLSADSDFNLSFMNIGSVNTNETKNTVFLYSDIAYLGLGAGGMKAFDINTKSKTPVYTVGADQFDEANDIVCNAVSADAKYIYLAAGEGGLWIAPRDSEGPAGELAIYSSISFGVDKSANFVYTDPKNHLVFAAGGEAGLVIISYETEYRVGDYGPAGGYIFYDKGEVSDGWRYLEAAPYDQAFTAQWGGKGTLIGANQDGLGAGYVNTPLIVNKLGKPYEYAAQLCSDLVIGSYDDWYLPSLAELKLIGTILYNNKIGNLYPSWYWSSTEDNKDNAWRYTYNTKIKTREVKDLKWNKYIVRAVRRF